MNNPRPASAGRVTAAPVELPPLAPTEAPKLAPRGGVARALLRTARPRQWIKNVLLFAAPGAAGALTHRTPLVHTIVGFALFCLVSSGTYFLNDALDYEADRLHPTKQHRPIAAGLISPRLAIGISAALVIAALVLSSALLSLQFAGIVAGYALVTISYSLWLKHEPVIDLAAVASGFIIRAVAGGIAAGVLVSNWFLIVVSFGSMFMVAGKRHAEHLDMGDEAADHRATLRAYSLSYLRYIRSTSSALAIAAYCLWAFEKEATITGIAWYEFSIIPIVLGIFRYALILETGAGSAPEEIVISDRVLQFLGLAWAVLFGLGVYSR
ncbi:MAG TPA: decaprenyl-phosphate phosphoribosyltransferase [Candidatus Dormibacteraeota bacterium]|jgi:decaprenyl-phosphate phosphoribosyltransferase|nr:decaprenyl-phosphate phosphoribosyltransferase [Candidatus Dormibacteraeota bacterium]